MKVRRVVNGLIIEKGERPDEWIITRNGNEHSIYFEKSKKVKECKLFVDEEEVKIPSTFITKYLCIEHVVYIEGKPIHCVYDGEKFDLAVNGYYINKKSMHYPIDKELGLLPIVLIMLVALASVFKNDGPHMSLKLGCIYGLGLVYPFYLHYLHMKEKKGQYDVIDDVKNQIKKINRQIIVITFLSIILLIATLYVIKCGWSIGLWLPMVFLFMASGVYVKYLIAKKHRIVYQE